MKTYKNLFEKLIDENNLLKALNKAAIGKRDRATVKELLDDPQKAVKEFREKLIAGNVSFKVKDAMIIREGYLKKTRVIICPEFKTAQWLHHAVVQVLKDFFCRGMYVYTCGSIPGRGIHYGKKYLEKYIRNNTAEIKYALKLDIKQYYPSVPIDRVKERLKRQILDERMLDILFKILDSNKVRVNGEIMELGLPIGYYTSQWFANWYLQPLDHFIKEQLHIKCYVRYMDDIVIFGRNKKQLRKDFEKIREYITSLGLEVKGNYQIFRFDYFDKQDNNRRKGRPIDFMGFKFYRDKTTIRSSIFLKARRAVTRIRRKNKITWYDACQIVSYLGWFYVTDTYGAYKKYIAPYVSVNKCKKVISNHYKEKTK